MQRFKPLAFVAAASIVAAPLFASPAAHAQAKMVKFTEMGTPTVAPASGGTTSAPVSVPTDKVKEPSGSASSPALPPVKVPEGAELLRQVSAPLNDKGDVLVLNVYKTSGEVYMDALTGKSGQQPISRNHVHLKSPLLIRPEKMDLSMRWLQADNKTGVEIVAEDESGSVALVFPKGFGGTAYQQQFATANAGGVRRSYDFTQNDSRGFAMVKSMVDSAGAVKPANDVQFYVWNGAKFIPRKAN